MDITEMYDHTYGGLSAAEKQMIDTANEEFGFKPDPSLLLHQNIPKPLHGIAPRVVLGRKWWDGTRMEAYKSTGFRCAACGVRASDAKFKQWLEAHEVYAFDYKNLRLTYLYTVPLCHACHSFIHCGRLRVMKDKGKLSEEVYREIIAHGKNVLECAGLPPSGEPETSKKTKWNDWRMEINGKLYGPSTRSYVAWKRGFWKYWKPDGDEIEWTH